MTKLWIPAVAVAAVGGLFLSSRRELQRYLMIRRADHDPSAVGTSITAQGNKAALKRRQR